MNVTMSTMSAVVIFLGCTAAMLAYTCLWALGTRKPVRPHPHLEGRPSVPYWYSPTGHQDERGIKSFQ
jgi:hypothetical protein